MTEALSLSLPPSRLYIQVEFQQPNKQPVPIFLYDVTADDSITVLSARVRTTCTVRHSYSYRMHGALANYVGVYNTFIHYERIVST